MVRWPRAAQSFRAGAMCLKAGWKFGAKKNAKLCSRNERAASSGVKSMRIPSASITSALPTDDVTARLPCLATVTPAAAHRMATVVEMLNVLKRSPPVPTTSRISRARVWASSGGWMDLSCSARAKAAISSGVSPLYASAARKPAFNPAETFSLASCSTACHTCGSASVCAALRC